MTMINLKNAELTELTATVVGKPMPRAATVTKAASRFIKACVVRGIDPEPILSMDMDAAREAIKPKPEPKAAKPKAAKPKSTGPKRAGSTRFHPDQVIESVANNPKREGTRAHSIFALYAPGMTVAQFTKKVEKAGHPASQARADLSWDTRKGFIKLKAEA